MAVRPVLERLRASKRPHDLLNCFPSVEKSMGCCGDNNSRRSEKAPSPSCPTPPRPSRRASGWGAGKDLHVVENFSPVIRTLPAPSRPRCRYFAGPGSTAAVHRARTSLSDVAEMNTVTWGPESSPLLPNRAHESDPSIFDHHVERGTKVVTRAARSCDWEGLSGSRQFTSEDLGSTIEEDPLLTNRSVSARNSRRKSSTFGSEIESLRPWTEEGVEGGEGHITPGGPIRSTPSHRGEGCWLSSPP